MKIPKECLTNTSEKIIVCEANGRQFRLENTKRTKVSKIQIDDCVVKGNQKKCDWLLEADAFNLAIYVELKGKKIDDAILQLESTLHLFNARHSGKTKKCLVVSSRVPASGADILLAKQQFKKKWKAEFHVKNVIHELKI
ncbi:MAG: hypothetical protein ACO1NO_12970 [Burkholderiaceae bacterium]